MLAQHIKHLSIALFILLIPSFVFGQATSPENNPISKPKLENATQPEQKNQATKNKPENSVASKILGTWIAKWSRPGEKKEFTTHIYREGNSPIIKFIYSLTSTSTDGKIYTCNQSLYRVSVFTGEIKIESNIVLFIEKHITRCDCGSCDLTVNKCEFTNGDIVAIDDMVPIGTHLKLHP